MLNLLKRIAGAWLPAPKKTLEFPELAIEYPFRSVTESQATSLSAFWAALRLFQMQIASLPIITYGRTEQGRERLTSRGEYKLLSQRPNPAMSRSDLWELNIRRLFLRGEFFNHLSWLGNGKLGAIYPIDPDTVVEVKIDENWRKTLITTDNVYSHDEFLHVHLFSLDGLRGVPLHHFASVNLGLHTQVLETLNALYRNAQRPLWYLKYADRKSEEFKNNTKQALQGMGGPSKAGIAALFDDGGSVEKFPSSTSEELQLATIASMSVDDIGRWFGVSSLQLNNLERGTYSNWSEAATGLYKQALRPCLDKIELELNDKIFLNAQDVYCEFLIEEILRGSPKEQADIFKIGVDAGYLLPSDVRPMLNLPPLPEKEEIQPVEVQNEQVSETPEEEVQVQTQEEGTANE